MKKMKEPKESSAGWSSGFPFFLGILVQIAAVLKRRVWERSFGHNAVTRVSGNVASDEFAVHSDGIAFDVEL